MELWDSGLIIAHNNDTIVSMDNWKPKFTTYLFIYLFWPSVDKKSYLVYKTPLFLQGLQEVVSKQPYS